DPRSKIQGRSKPQAPNSRGRIFHPVPHLWTLDLGASLDLGSWIFLDGSRSHCNDVTATHMDWIKRNLYFVIGSLVALLLLGAAGWYFYSSYKADGEALDKLREQYANLGRLNSAPIQP